MITCSRCKMEKEYAGRFPYGVYCGNCFNIVLNEEIGEGGARGMRE